MAGNLAVWRADPRRGGDRSFRRAKASVGLAVSLIVPFAVYNLLAQPPVTCSIEGTVTRAGSDTPLPKVEIAISRPGSQEPPLVVITEGTGRFIAGGLEPGRYSVRAQRNGYVSQLYGQRGKIAPGVPLMLEPGQTLRDIDFNLIPTCVITGRVLDENGDPRVGVYVETAALQYRGGQRRLISGMRTSTNDLGEYRLYGLPPGRYFVKTLETGPRTPIRKPAGAPLGEQYVPTCYPGVTDVRQAAIVDVPEGTEVRGIDITTLRKRAFRVRGKILGMDRTAHFARLEVEPIDTGFDVAYTPREAMADQQGNFDINGIIPGAYMLSATFMREGKSYAALRGIEIGNADLEGVSLAVSPGLEVQGRVRLEGDKRIDLGALSISLHPRFFWLTGEPSTRVNADGSFLLRVVGHDTYQFGLSGLPEDVYVRSVRVGDEEAIERRINLNAGSPPAPLEVVVSASGGQIDGVVRNDKEEPASGATVLLAPDVGQRGESYLFKETISDNTARFTIQGIVPGKYTLLAFDAVEPGAWEDPNFLQPYETKGEKVTIEPKNRSTYDLHVIRVQAVP